MALNGPSRENTLRNIKNHQNFEIAKDMMNHTNSKQFKVTNRVETIPEGMSDIDFQVIKHTRMSSVGVTSNTPPP